MVRLVRHCQTKETETDRPNLNHYASSLLYPSFCYVKLINRMKKLILKIAAYKLVLISVAFLVIFSVGCAKKDEKEIKIEAILT